METTCEVPLERLEAIICEGSANLTSAERDWLLAVAEFDRREGWKGWGCVSCAAWLSWQVGLDLRAAREKLRVARALELYPLVSAAMERGELSYSKVRAITRVIEPETESSLVTMALAGTTNHVERIVSAYRRAERRELAEEARQHAARELRHRVDDDGSIVMTVRLPAEAGVAVLAAVEQFVVRGDIDERGRPEPLAARRADALVRMAEVATVEVADGHDEPRYLVTVHVDADAMSDPRGRHIDDSPSGRCDVGADQDSVEQPVGVPAETARRAACDCDIEEIIEMSDGDVLRMGRRSRVVRNQLKRAVRVRDGGCRFPGCPLRGRVDAHHIVHWIDGGATDIDNLVCLCRFHHRWLHEGGWWIEGQGHLLQFCSSDGREIDARPPIHRGDPAAVRAKGRTARDGRCRWGGERLDLDLAITALICRRAEYAHSPGSV